MECIPSFVDNLIISIVVVLSQLLGHTIGSHQSIILLDQAIKAALYSFGHHACYLRSSYLCVLSGHRTCAHKDIKAALYSLAIIAYYHRSSYLCILSGHRTCAQKTALFLSLQMWKKIDKGNIISTTGIVPVQYHFQRFFIHMRKVHAQKTDYSQHMRTICILGVYYNQPQLYIQLEILLGHRTCARKTPLLLSLQSEKDR